MQGRTLPRSSQVDEDWATLPGMSESAAHLLSCAVKEFLDLFCAHQAEALEQLPAGERPTHLFAQGGVGGRAAAVCIQAWWRYGAEPSLIAWEILDEGADAFMTVPDHAALAVMRLLADGVGGDRPLVANESAVAGPAGAMAVAAAPDLRAGLGLTHESRVLVFGTEGATDPELYARIVGRPAEAVRAV